MASKTQQAQLDFLTKGGGTLSDTDIQKAIDAGYLNIQAPQKLNVQPSSLEIHLAPTILVFARRRVGDGTIDLKKPVDQFMDYEVIDPKKGAVLHPGEFILGMTQEYFEMPEQLSANVDGKSSLGRIGFIIHATAGFIDPGYKGHITLEITNLTEQPLIMYPGMPVGQVRFNVLTSPVTRMYGPKIGSKYTNKYSENPKPQPSQFWKNFTK